MLHSSLLPLNRTSNGLPILTGSCVLRCFVQFVLTCREDFTSPETVGLGSHAFSLCYVCCFFRRHLLPRNQEQQSPLVCLRRVPSRTLQTSLLCPHILILPNHVWVVFGLAPTGCG